jgi:hypothetical protein
MSIQLFLTKDDNTIIAATVFQLTSIASCIYMGANPICGFLTASQIRLAGVERHVASFLNKLIRRSVISTMARSSRFGSAVQNKLDTEIDIIAFGIARDLNAVSKATESSVGPATLNTREEEILGEVQV